METASRVAILDVAIDSRTGGAEAVYSYRDPGGMDIGQAVLVPLGPRTVLGFVVDRREVAPEEFEFPLWNLKTPSSSVDGLKLPIQVVEMVKFISCEFLCSLSSALVAAIPPGAKDRLVTTWALTGQSTSGEKLTAAQQEVLRVIVAQGGQIQETKTKPMTAGAKKTLRLLKSRGLITEQLALATISDVHRLSGRLRMTSDASLVEKFLAGPGRKRPAQTHLLMLMQGSESTSFAAQEVKALSGSTDQTIRALIQAGLLEKINEDFVIPKMPPTPNPHQQEAIDLISQAVKDHQPRPFLLYGVTGSGKTEVFLRTAADALKLGRQVLYLVPEISLTPQVIAKLKERFGKSVAVLHSNMNPTERIQNWMRAATGESAVVLGPRSALFAPLNNLGLIIMDEEHESSYKQEQHPRYHTRTAAKFLARQHGCPIVFGSATPAIESAYAAEIGEYQLIQMPYRAASATMPDVHIEDLTEQYSDRRKPSIFADILRNALIDTLKAENQAIFFLNRRAYSPFLMCRECGHQFMCPHCAVSLSYHQREQKLKCHYCDHQERLPETCPSCGGLKIGPLGIGVERVEEYIRDTFPGVRVARLDRDIAQKKGALEETLALFRTGEIDVLVGTQMVAKGLDFPRVTLVGVIAADISLNIPDFRAPERTFQLLSQVAGRAGRGAIHGQVVIQTFNPLNEAILYAQKHDFQAFYERAIAERRDANYPPFCKLINVVFSGPDLPSVIGLANDSVMAMRQFMTGVDILGPVECPLSRLKDQWRMHALIKMPPDMPSSFVSESLEKVTRPKGTSLSIDVDPYSMM